MYTEFDEEVFKASVNDALETVRKVLDVRHRRRRRHQNNDACASTSTTTTTTDNGFPFHLAEDVDHRYDDKYKLVDLLTNTAIVSLMVVLERLGLTKDALRSITKDDDDDQSLATTTTLRFACSDSCGFVKEETVDVPIVRTTIKSTNAEKTEETKAETTKTTSSASEEEFAEFFEMGKEESTDTTSTGKSEKKRASTTTIKEIVNRVTRRHYKIGRKWEISLYEGTDLENRRVLLVREGAARDFVSSSFDPRSSPSSPPPPLPPKRDHDPIELSLTWLLRSAIDARRLKSHFAIDQRRQKTTPRRNPQVDEAVSFFCSFERWAREVRHRFVSFYHPDNICDSNNTTNEQQTMRLLSERLGSLTADPIFVPILPLMIDNEEADFDHDHDHEMQEEEIGDDSLFDKETVLVKEELESKATVSLQKTDGEEEETDDGLIPSSKLLLSANDTTRFINEQIRTLDEMKRQIENEFPDGKTTASFLSSAEAEMCVLCIHAANVTERYVQSVNYVEFALEKQLITAIGKKVCESDLDKFVAHHNARMFHPPPKPFTYSIRRPNHYPEGILSIEQQQQQHQRRYNNSTDTATAEPVQTHVREFESMTPLRVPLNAATTIELSGKTYLHGWVNHRFGGGDGGGSKKEFRLTARARQFSSFVLIVGIVTGGNRMMPRDAIILRNKDEVRIPLLLNEIPTAGEFKDAIGSLSPEQRRFAKAFRSMQLESSLLGVCVVQIKPQMEKLLGLPPDSLTKEMKLTHDLTELFVTYQIPSDLVSCDYVGDDDPHDDDDGDGDEDGATTKNNRDNKKKLGKEKVENVKSHVKTVVDVITEQKKEQLEDQVMATDMALEKKQEQEEPATIMRRSVSGRSGYGGRGGHRNAGSVFAASGRSGYGCRLKSAARVSSDRTFVAASSRSRMMCNAQMPLLSAAAMASAPMPGTAPARSLTVAATASSFESCYEDFGSSSKETRATPNDANNNTDSNRKETSNKTNQAIFVGNHDPNNGDGGSMTAMDITMMPKRLDGAIEMYTEDHSLRSTTVEASKKGGWSRTRQENLLTKPVSGRLDETDISAETNRAYDLLDALSRSGSLPIEFAELHVVVCATHRFEKTVMETVVRDNVNPIEKLELSTLIMASAVFGLPITSESLIQKDADRNRIRSSFSRLLLTDKGDAKSSSAPESASPSADGSSPETCV